MSYLTPTLRKERFSSDYYKTRNYRNYLERKFEALAEEIVAETRIRSSDEIVDFGCGFGGLVNALWVAGFTRIHGTDISQWAIEYGHTRFPKLARRLQFYNRDLLRRRNKLTLFLDVLEHMPEYEIESVLNLARQGAKGVVVVRIPVSAQEGEPFVLPVSNNDPTHICCHTKAWWLNMFRKSGFQLRNALQASAIYDSPGVLAACYR